MQTQVQMIQVIDFLPSICGIAAIVGFYEVSQHTPRIYFWFYTLEIGAIIAILAGIVSALVKTKKGRLTFLRIINAGWALVFLILFCVMYGSYL